MPRALAFSCSSTLAVVRDFSVFFANASLYRTETPATKETVCPVDLSVALAADTPLSTRDYINTVVIF